MALSTRMFAAFTASVVGTVQCGEPNKHLRAIKEHTPDADDDFPEAEFSNRMHRVAGGKSSMIENVSPTPFLSVPREQFDALSNHHRASIRLANFRRANATSFLQGPEDGNHTSFADDSADAFENDYTDTVSKLQQKGSQYLADIDVGTQLSEGCDKNADVTKVPYRFPSELQGKSSMVESGTCYATSSEVAKVVCDTGSNNLWMQYNTGSSLTFKKLLDKPVSVTFATAKVNGSIVRDNFCVGGIRLQNQMMGFMDKQEGGVFKETGLDGILGLAFPAMAARKGTSVFDSMLEQGQVKKPMFSFYLSRHNPTSNVISWGGVVPELYTGKFIHVPVVDPYYWSVGLYSFKIGDEEILPGVNLQSAAAAALVEQGQNFVPANSNKYDYPLIFDSGTTFFTASSAPSTEPGVSFIQKVLTELPAAPCDQVTDKTHPDLTFVVRDTKGQHRDLSFTNKEYMTSPDGKQCNSAFMEVNVNEKHSKNGAFLWGEVPMRKYYTVHTRDPENNEAKAKVSLALAKQGEEVEKIIAGLTKSKQAFEIGEDVVGAEAAPAA